MPRNLTVPIFTPGEIIGVDVGGTIQFYAITLGGDLSPAGRAADPAPSDPLTIDPTTHQAVPTTRETPLEFLNPMLSVRAYNVLKREGVHTIGNLLDFYEGNGEDGFADMRNMGQKAQDEIVDRIRLLQGVLT